MKNFAMKRQIKYALTVHNLNSGRFSKTDRQRSLIKCKKRSMRRFIQKDAEQEILDAINGET